MKVQRYTATGKWSKPSVESTCMDRMGGTVHNGKRITVIMTDGKNLITINRGEYELIKAWFEER